MASENPIVDPKHYAEFMQAYARGLLVWQMVEQNLFFIFSHLINSNAQTPVVSAVYHTVINFNARLEMTDAAMKMAFHGSPKLGEWETLIKTMNTCSKLRNKLAHSTLILHTNHGNKSLRLSPSAFDVREGQDSEYTLGQIADWGIQFKQLALSLADFSSSIQIKLPDHRSINIPD